MKTIICPHCGRNHALYWYVQPNSKTVHYTCDAVERHTFSKLDGRPEVNKITQRCELDFERLGRLTAFELAQLPVVESLTLQKAQADQAQCKLPL